MNYNKSQKLFSRAQQSIPGGVNSPVRAFRSVGGNPIFIKSAKGAYLFDEDGNQFIDYINSWGPMILGHAYEPVVKAIQEKAADSTSFGSCREKIFSLGMSFTSLNSFSLTLFISALLGLISGLI